MNYDWLQTKEDVDRYFQRLLKLKYELVDFSLQTTDIKVIIAYENFMNGIKQ